jgi:hypothetical protein
MLEENFLTKFNPAVSKNWLLVLAGIMWSGVGILLCGYAVTWLAGSPSVGSLLLGITDLAISWAVYRYGFSKIAQKNIDRILLYANKACLFSFQSWSGYIIIAVMMTGGILLKSSPIPKPYLAIMYTAIGGGLFLSSFRYYARFTLVSRKKSALV